MTAESVCVSVSLIPPCYWLGAPNMLLFSNKWWVGMAHSRQGLYSCQDNSQFCRWTGIWSSHFSSICCCHGGQETSATAFLRLIRLCYVFNPESRARSRNMWCTVRGKSAQIESQRTKICSCRKIHGGTVCSRKMIYIYDKSRMNL